ncbi:MAG: hypothetical protein IT516_12500 [Burkholderiales bacterium]|nr:hypothetical protein [Burkholderiales bacterium]
MTLAWGAKVSPQFRARVLGIAAGLRCDPSWLMAIMAFETGRSFSPAARNAASGATGLIQFLPSTARGLDTTTDALAAMTAVEQLAYVERYFASYAGRLATLSDAYMAVLWPKGVGQPETYPIFERGSTAYAQNKRLDVDDDGIVTKAEAALHVTRVLVEGLRPENATEEREGRAAPLPAPPPGMPSIQPQEPRMNPILAAALPQIIGMIPSLAAVFSKPEQAERNQKAAQVVVDAFTAAVPGAVNVQDALERADADPAIRATAVAAVEASPTIAMLVEIGGGVAAARQANVEYMAGVEDDEWWRMLLKIVANPAMIISAAGLYIVYRFVPALADQVTKLSPEVVASLITSIVVGTLGAIFGFWLGQTWQQKREDTLR